MNNELRRLHVERMNRLNGIVPAASTAAAPVAEPAVNAFECPVCYMDGAASGIVEPACKHKICLACYSNILMRESHRTKCPCCRKLYLAPAVAEAVDDYSDMPPLMNAAEAAYLISGYALIDNIDVVPADIHNRMRSRSNHVLDIITSMNNLVDNMNIIHYEDPLTSNMINITNNAPLIPNQQTMDQ